MHYKLRTLLILLAILPPLLWIGWGKYEAWQAGAVWLRRLIIHSPMGGDRRYVWRAHQ